MLPDKHGGHIRPQHDDSTDWIAGVHIFNKPEVNNVENTRRSINHK